MFRARANLVVNGVSVNLSASPRLNTPESYTDPIYAIYVVIGADLEARLRASATGTLALCEKICSFSLRQGLD